MKVYHFTLLLLIACSVFVPLGTAAESVQPIQYAEEETLLLDVLSQVREQKLDAALVSAETLIELNPKFRLAQLVYGDLLQAKARPIGTFGTFGNLPADQEKAIDGLRQEAHSRLKRHTSSPLDTRLPAYLLRLAPSQNRVVVVDLNLSRLYLFEHRSDGIHLLADYYAASGKNGAVKFREGDNKTPVGVYFVSGHIAEKILPDLYGAGAFPIDYPNPWDRRQGRTGYGIWLHGVPSDTYSRPPRSSNGCVALANADLTAIMPFIEVGHTPVIIAEDIQWQDPKVVLQRGKELETAMEKWRQDWESRDMARYASNYSPSAFLSDNRNYSAWIGHKSQINKKKSYIKVQLSDLSLFTDPANPDLVVARFQQEYQSSNYKNRSRKRQYWQRESDSIWRIVYEGSD